MQDFAKWSGLAAADARAGTEAIAPRLEREVIGGRTHWSGGSAPAPRPEPTTAHLLSIYDEYVSSYRDRSALCDPEYARRLLGMGNTLAIVVVDGRVAGTWRRTIDKRTVHVQITPFRGLGGAERRAVETAAGHFAAFVNRELVLEVESAARRRR